MTDLYISFLQFIYDAEEGDWGFFEIKKNDHVGVEFQFMSTPATADDWYFTAINMHMIYGFSMVEEPVIVWLSIYSTYSA